MSGNSVSASSVYQFFLYRAYRPLFWCGNFFGFLISRKPLEKFFSQRIFDILNDIRDQSWEVWKKPIVTAVSYSVLISTINVWSSRNYIHQQKSSKSVDWQTRSLWNDKQEVYGMTKVQVYISLEKRGLSAPVELGGPYLQGFACLLPLLCRIKRKRWGETTHHYQSGYRGRVWDQLSASTVEENLQILQRVPRSVRTLLRFVLAKYANK